MAERMRVTRKKVVAVGVDMAEFVVVVVVWVGLGGFLEEC